VDKQGNMTDISLKWRVTEL